MSTLSAQPAVRLPLGRLAAVQCAAAIGACLLGGAIVWMIAPASAAVGLVGLLSVLVGIGGGLCVFWLGGPKPVFTIATMQVGASTVRMVGGLALCAWLLMASRGGGADGFDPLMLLGVFMLGQVAALIAELGVILPILKGNGTKLGAAPDMERVA